MKSIKSLLQRKTAKTKKSIGGIIAGIVIVGVVVSIFFGTTDFVGLIISAGILVVTVGAMYFLLKWTNDLPDMFDWPDKNHTSRLIYHMLCIFYLKNTLIYNEHWLYISVHNAICTPFWIIDYLLFQRGTVPTRIVSAFLFSNVFSIGNN